ncbi:MAG: CocE/NonD family hydrolase [Actinomycetes bacterium]
MRRRHPVLILGLICSVAAVLLAACGGEDAASERPATSTSVRKIGPPVQKCAPPNTGDIRATTVNGSTSDVDVTSFDGTVIRAHWFPLPGASAAQNAPTVLMGPGWGLAGDTDPKGIGILGAVSIGGLHNAGYNVLTWDPRGFGKSGGEAKVDNEDFEGRDTQRLISWVATQPQVALDAPGDPRMGMVGASYGGGIQFVTAAIDCRVDAIVPVIAWNSLSTSLYKGKVPKTGWATILTGVSALGRIDPHIPSAKKSGDATGTVSAEDAAWFRSRGPGSLVGDVQVPALIVQGTVDTLFTLAEGVTNYQIIQNNDVPVAMTWFCGGHGLCNARKGDPQRVSTNITNWLNRYVKQDPTAALVPGFDTVDQDGARHTAPAWPLTRGAPITATGSGTLQLVAEGGSAGPARSARPDDTVGRLSEQIMPGVATNAVNVRVASGDRDALVIGAPKLRLSYTGTVTDGVRPTAVFAQLVDDSNRTIVGQQITPIPLRLDGARHDTTVDLEMISFHVRPGTSLTLQLVATCTAYATPRLGGSVTFSGIDLQLPTVRGTTSPR